MKGVDIDPSIWNKFGPQGKRGYPENLAIELV